MDEAKRKNINIDLKKLSNLLGVPVVGTSARSGKAMQEVEPHIQSLVCNQITSKWVALRLIDGDTPLLESMNDYLKFNLSQDSLLQKQLGTARNELETENIAIEDLGDLIVSNIVKTAENISKEVISLENKSLNGLDRKIDSILTSKIFGIPIMIALLGLVFWLTIKGINVPSAMLAQGLFWIESRLTVFTESLALWHYSVDYSQRNSKLKVDIDFLLSPNSNWYCSMLCGCSRSKNAWTSIKKPLRPFLLSTPNACAA